MARIRKKLVSLGCTVTVTKSGHYKVRHPDAPGRLCVLGASPSDPRFMDNTKADLRRELGIQL